MSVGLRWNSLKLLFQRGKIMKVKNWADMNREERDHISLAKINFLDKHINHLQTEMERMNTVTERLERSKDEAALAIMQLQGAKVEAEMMLKGDLVIPGAFDIVH